MRILIAVAHADDETLACFSLMRRRSDEVHILHATDSAPHDLRYAQRAGYETREEYKAARYAEFFAVLASSDIPAHHCHSLDIADLDAPRHTSAIRQAVVDLAPDRIYTHAYEGGHPDHDALAKALSGLNGLMEFPLYHAQGGAYQPQRFIEGGPSERVELSPSEQALKSAWLSHYESQQRVIANFPLRYEIFRPAPAYDFSRPPHEGPLYYEIRGHVWTWPEWRKAISES